jgi:hypothetical protein
MRNSPKGHTAIALLVACALAAACNRGTQQAQNGPAAQGGQAVQNGQAAPAAGQAAQQDGQPGQPAGQPAAGAPAPEQQASQPQGATPPQGAVLPPDATPAQQDAAAAATSGQRLPITAGQQGDLRAGGQRLAGDRQVAADTVLVPSGTHLTVELERTLSSNGSRPGESFRARVLSPVTERGLVVIPSGAEVVGVVTTAMPPGRIGGRARLGVRFTELLLPSGASVPIRASYAIAGHSKTGRDAAIIGGSAAGGGIIGHNVNRGNRGKGTLIGALVGAAVGTAVAANVPGRPVVIPSGATLRLRLRGGIEVPVPR